jgi:hypothetical protein
VRRGGVETSLVWLWLNRAADAYEPHLGCIQTNLESDWINAGCNDLFLKDGILGCVPGLRFSSFVQTSSAWAPCRIHCMFHLMERVVPVAKNGAEN